MAPRFGVTGPVERSIEVPIGTPPSSNAKEHRVRLPLSDGFSNEDAEVLERGSRTRHRHERLRLPRRAAKPM
jgi:hypothetical protein